MTVDRESRRIGEPDMQVTAKSTTPSAAAQAATAKPSSASGKAFAQALNTQTQTVTARSKTTKSGRVMRPIMVPKAASPKATGGTATVQTPMTAAQTRAAYGEGTLATILARIKRA